MLMIHMDVLVLNVMAVQMKRMVADSHLPAWWGRGPLAVLKERQKRTTDAVSVTLLNLYHPAPGDPSWVVIPVKTWLDASCSAAGAWLVGLPLE